MSNIHEFDITAPLIKSGVVIGMNKQELIIKRQNLFLNIEDENTLILGGAKTGKTRDILIPTVLAAALSGESFIVVDRKAEIYNDTTEYLSQQNYNIIVIKLDEQNEESLEGLISITELNDFVNSRTVIFFILDEYEDKNKFAVTMIDRLFTRIIKQADSSNGYLSKNISFIIDDCAMLPYINDFDKMLSIGPGRGIKFIVSIQALYQLEQIYPKQNELLLGNFKSKLFTGTADMATANYISGIVGKTLKIDEVLRFNREKELFISSDNTPYINDKPDTTILKGLIQKHNM